jgi:branched-subunit amino acid permease
MEIYTNNKNYLIDGFVDDYNTTDIFAPLAVEMIVELETRVRLLTRELSDFS